MLAHIPGHLVDERTGKISLLTRMIVASGGSRTTS
jgi:hypothetical protein